MDDDTEDSALQIGEESFGIFYSNDSFSTLVNIVEHKKDIVKHTKVINEKGDKYTVAEFLELLTRLKVRTN
tara:strand:+ start:2371 stop:2583 length:213 start_codon:yes stop_codon:yes gene_type:complete